MKKIMVLICISWITLNCGSDDEGTTTLDIWGEWNWIRSTGGIAGTTYTPESTGEQRKLIITADSIKRFTNGELVSRAAYNIIRSTVGDVSVEIIVPEPEGIRQIIEVDKNKLILTEDCSDCFVNEYIRE